MESQRIEKDKERILSKTGRIQVNCPKEFLFRNRLETSNTIAITKHVKSQNLKFMYLFMQLTI